MSMFSCRRYSPLPIDRRAFLRQAGCGFASVALTAMLADEVVGQAPEHETASGETAQKASGTPQRAFAAGPKQPHHGARAKNVIYLYMDGGPSQVDTFDPKPRLNAEHGKPFALKMEPTQFNNNGNTLGCPWEFRQHGESGIPVSALFPNVARHVDRLAVIRSMVSNFPEHTSANY